MNDRIKDMYIQTADETADGKEWAIGGLHNANRFAELIIRECSRICGSQADQRNILKHFGFPVESNVRAPGPEPHWSVTSQYTRDYNIPKQS